MIKITLGRIADAFTSKAIEHFGAFSLPVKTAFKNAKIIKAMQKEFELFEQQRVELAKKHGKFDPAKNVYNFDDAAKVACFNNELTELRSIEVELPVDPIDIDSLGENSLSSSDLLILLPLFSNV
jgi:hypothetical protein